MDVNDTLNFNETTPLYQNYTSTVSSQMNSTLSNDIYFYGSSITFIILILCVITFIIILKSKKKFLIPK